MLVRTRSLLLLAGLSLLLAACKDRPDPVTPPRAVLHGEGGQYSIVPTAGQLPYCLVVETRDGAARSLVTGEDGQSADCDAGKTLGPWKLPVKDDPFRTFVIFSDRRLKGDTIALQIRELLAGTPGAAITPMDLRAPGQVTVVTMDVRPKELRPAQ